MLCGGPASRLVARVSRHDGGSAEAGGEGGGQARAAAQLDNGAANDEARGVGCEDAAEELACERGTCAGHLHRLVLGWGRGRNGDGRGESREQESGCSDMVRCGGRVGGGELGIEGGRLITSIFTYGTQT